jgi:hypothetical protein
VRHVEHDLPHPGQRLLGEHRLLLESVHGGNVSAVVLLRSGRRRVRLRRGLLHRDLHHRRGTNARYLRRVAPGRSRELRRCRWTALRRDGHERARGRTRGGVARVRGIVLQPCMRAVGSKRGPGVPAG